jgi:hypothetical protein
MGATLGHLYSVKVDVSSDVGYKGDVKKQNNRYTVNV